MWLQKSLNSQIDSVGHCLEEEAGPSGMGAARNEEWRGWVLCAPEGGLYPKRIKSRAFLKVFCPTMFSFQAMMNKASDCPRSLMGIFIAKNVPTDIYP